MNGWNQYNIIAVGVNASALVTKAAQAAFADKSPPVYGPGT